MTQDFPLPDSLVRLPRDLVLSYGGFSLPHSGNISMLQDGDQIEVKTASTRRKQPSSTGAPTPRLPDSTHPSYRPNHDSSRDRRDFHQPQSTIHSEDRRDMEPSHLPSSRMDGMAPLLAPRSLLERRLDRKRGRSPEDSDRGMFRSRGRPDEPVRHERGRSVVRERAVVPVREDRGRSVVRGRLDGAERGRSDARGLLPREVHDRGKYAARGRSVARHEYHDVDYDTRERDLGLSTRASQVSTRDEAYFGHCGSAPSFKCFVCSEKLGLPRERCMIAPKLMRAHVAAHILSGETTAFACGFCGRDDSRCYSYIDRGSSKHRVVPSSNCPYFYKFQVSAIINPRCKGPVCTNIPVLCPGCRDITYVWKYGMQEHWVHCHQDLIRAGKRMPDECKVSNAEKAVMLLTQSASFNRNVDLLMANSGDPPESESVDLRDRSLPDVRDQSLLDLRDRSLLDRPRGRNLEPERVPDRGRHDDRWEEGEEEGLRLDDDEEEEEEEEDHLMDHHLLPSQGARRRRRTRSRTRPPTRDLPPLSTSLELFSNRPDSRGPSMAADALSEAHGSEEPPLHDSHELGVSGSGSGALGASTKLGGGPASAIRPQQQLQQQLNPAPAVRGAGDPMHLSTNPRLLLQIPPSGSLPHSQDPYPAPRFSPVPPGSGEGTLGTGAGVVPGLEGLADHLWPIRTSLPNGRGSASLTPPPPNPPPPLNPTPNPAPASHPTSTPAPASVPSPPPPPVAAEDNTGMIPGPEAAAAQAVDDSGPGAGGEGGLGGEGGGGGGGVARVGNFTALLEDTPRFLQDSINLSHLLGGSDLISGQRMQTIMDAIEASGESRRERAEGGQTQGYHEGGRTQVPFDSTRPPLGPSSHNEDLARNEDERARAALDQSMEYNRGLQSIGEQGGLGEGRADVAPTQPQSAGTWLRSMFDEMSQELPPPSTTPRLPRRTEDDQADTGSPWMKALNDLMMAEGSGGGGEEDRAMVESLLGGQAHEGARRTGGLGRLPVAFSQGDLQAFETQKQPGATLQRHGSAPIPALFGPQDSYPPHDQRDPIVLPAPLPRPPRINVTTGGPVTGLGSDGRLISPSGGSLPSHRPSPAQHHPRGGSGGFDDPTMMLRGSRGGSGGSGGLESLVRAPPLLPRRGAGAGVGAGVGPATMDRPVPASRASSQHQQQPKMDRRGSVASLSNLAKSASQAIGGHVGGGGLVGGGGTGMMNDAASHLFHRPSHPNINMQLPGPNHAERRKPSRRQPQQQSYGHGMHDMGMGMGMGHGLPRSLSHQDIIEQAGMAAAEAVRVAAEGIGLSSGHPAYPPPYQQPGPYDNPYYY